ncbi:hypothetical protein ABT300_37440 [Streptomyces sp. NPDC001027]|uniref:hypothetical protein n=1 Tax=Streptomyces sp. NPDC001027 TaxID=3154771 RepID=UPI00332AFCCA
MPFGAVANTAAAPCSQQEATDSTAANADLKEAAIPTKDEPTGSHRQSNPDQHLEGPPLGEGPQAKRLSPARMRARRLLDTASDELVRVAVKAIVTFTLGCLYYWLQSR